MSAAPSLATLAAAVLLYGAATTKFYLDVLRPAEAGAETPLAPWLLCGAALAHTAHVAVASASAHVCPVYSVHFFLSVASLLATAVYLTARARFRIYALGTVVAPVGLVLALGTFLAGRASPQDRLPAAFIVLHVFAILVGVALFLLAAAAAGMYLLQERRLKRRRAAPTGRLSSLDALDRAAHRFLLAGFPLLTLGVATGAAATHHFALASAPEILRVLLGYGTWLLFAAVLLLCVLCGWRGRRAAYGTVAGFACALAVMLGYLVRPLFAVGG
jgi:ABC-type uncharacterized transport system permease subunit